MESLLVGSSAKPATPSIRFAVASGSSSSLATGGRVKSFQSCNSRQSVKKLQLQKASLMPHVDCLGDPQRFSLYKIRSPKFQRIQTNAGSIDAPKSADDVHPASPIESLKNFGVALYKFTRPYAAVGTIVGTVAYSLFAAERLTDFTPMFVMKTLEALVAAMFMHVFIGGFNQIEDLEIDKVNKPNLPLASGELSYGAGVAITWSAALTGVFLAWKSGSVPLLWAISLWWALGFAYSAHLPLLRWKGKPHTAAFYMMTERALVAIAYFINAQTHIVGRAAAITTRGVFALGMLTSFSLVIAFVKDIPDVEGDLKHGIRSFAARFGAERVFWFSVWFLEITFGAAILMGLSSPITWSRYATVLGHGLMALIYWVRAKAVDLNNQESVLEFYTFIWKLLYAEYLLLPLVR